MNLHIAIGLLLAVIGQTSGLEKMAEACDPSICRLPTCYCGGTAVRNKLIGVRSCRSSTFRRCTPILNWSE